MSIIWHKYCKTNTYLLLDQKLDKGIYLRKLSMSIGTVSLFGLTGNLRLVRPILHRTLIEVDLVVWWGSVLSRHQKLSQINKRSEHFRCRIYIWKWINCPMYKTTQSLVFSFQRAHLLVQLIALGHYVTQAFLLGMKFRPYLGFNCWCRLKRNTESMGGMRHKPNIWLRRLHLACRCCIICVFVQQVLELTQFGIEITRDSV